MFDPQQALLNLLQPGSTNQTLFPPTSRYCGIPTSTIVLPDGNMEVFLQRRFLPPLGQTRSLRHLVAQGERLDHIAYKYLSDPEQFWRIADANTKMDADKLLTAGSRIRIPIDTGF